MPLNGLLALLRGDLVWRPKLAEQGFRPSLLEATVQSSAGTIRADALIYRSDPALVLLGEGKGGANIDEPQARSYVAADATALRRAGTIPHDLRGVDPLPVAPLFVALEENRARIELGLTEAGIHAPLLTVGRDRIRLTGSSSVDGLDDFDIHGTFGLPPARVPIDHQSADEEILELALPQIVAAAARREQFVDVMALCAGLIPEWPLMSRQAREALTRRVEQALRGAFAGPLRDTYRLDPGGQAHARVAILRTPADLDPRGATQSWQSQQKKASASLGRTRTPPIPGQISLDDLAEEGGLADV